MNEPTKHFQKNLSLWAKTCPKQAVLLPYINTLHVTPCITKVGETNLKLASSTATTKFSLHTQSGAKNEASKWFHALPLDNVPLVCVYGVGLGYYYDEIVCWLKQDSTRHLVFLEDDLAIIHQLFQTERGTQILENPQVQLLFFDHVETEESTFEGLYWNFAMTRLVVSALNSYARNKSEVLDELRHKIAYDAAMKNALVDEYMRYGANYYINFYRNMLCLGDSYCGNKFFGKFHKVPAIICGAGPSLEKNLPHVRRLLDKALVFAGGSALNVLNSAGFQPHFGLGIDPNPAQYTRMSQNQGYEVPFFYRNRMFHDAFEMIHGPRLYITGAGGYDTATYFEENLGIKGELLDEGHNVVNFCVEVANAMGCDPIIFVGMDLAFTGMREYAPGVIENASVKRSVILEIEDEDSRAIVKDDLYGKPTYTLWKWVAESVWIGDFAQSHPNITMINCTEGGLGFPGVPNMPLKKASGKFLQKCYELKNRIHGETQNNTLKNVTPLKISKMMTELSESLERVMDDLEILTEEAKAAIVTIKATKKVPSESGRGALAETELLDEIAYKYVLEVFSEVYARILSGDLHEIQVRRYSIAQRAAKKYALTIRKFQFLSDVAKINKELIAYAFRDRNQRKMGGKVDVDTPPLPPVALYVIDKGRLVIRDEEMHLSIDESFSPVMIPPAPKDGTKISPNHCLRVFFDSHWKLCECYPERDGKPDGQGVLYYPNGKIKEEVFYRNGVLHGPSRFWDPKGLLLAESWFINGKQVGKSWWYYSSGKIYSLQRYQDGEWHGQQVFYHKNGRLKSLLNYALGKLVEDPILLRPDGSPDRDNKAERL
ncbi:MAG: 6-hydroxymethylpterin diphosphokinase MptE-like protein [Parachlamydiaceae bacterium]